VKPKRLGVALILLVLVIAGIVLLAFPDSSDDSGGDLERPAGPGFVWLEGEWLRPPFFVETDASVLRVNNKIVRRVTRIAGEPEVVASDQQEPDTLGDLMEAAVTRFQDLGGPSSDPPTDATLADLTQFVESLPGAASVSFEAPALAITDDTGEVGFVILERPDPLSQQQAIKALQAVTTRWTEALRAGDVLLFSGDVTVEVPASQAMDFLRQLVAIFDLPAADQEAQMVDLIGSQEVAEGLLASGLPPSFVTKRLAQLAPAPGAQSTSSLVSLTLPGPNQAPVALQAQGDQNRTPSINKAFLFQPIDVEGPGWCSPEPVIKAAKLHGYQVIHLRGNASTIAATIASSGRAGIFYFCGHWHSIEPATNRADLHAKMAEYRQKLGLTKDDIYGVVSMTDRIVDGKAVPQYYVGAGSSFYKKVWKSANTIVFRSECHGDGIAPGFNAREFIAIQDQCFGTEAQQKLDTDFFGRLAGTVNNGLSRPVGLAFNATFAGTAWVLLGTGKGQTVLSPAVADYEPQTAVPISPTVPIVGYVKFDAPVNQVVTSVIEHIFRAEGCGAAITGRRWVDPYTYEFSFTTAEPGPLTFTVDSTWATSADDLALKLDGNQDPPNTDHVGPNHDNFVWTAECTTSVAPPTPGTSPPTPTQTTASTGCSVRVATSQRGTQPFGEGLATDIRVDIADEAGEPASGYSVLVDIDKAGTPSTASATTEAEGRITFRVQTTAAGQNTLTVKEVRSPADELCSYAEPAPQPQTWTTGDSASLPTPTPELAFVNLSCDHRIPGVESDVIVRGSNFEPGSLITGSLTGPGVIGDGNFSVMVDLSGNFEARIPIGLFGDYTADVDLYGPQTITVGEDCPG